MRFVVDTSAIVAVLNGEPGAKQFHEALLHHEPLMSAGSMIETQRVVQLLFGEQGLGGLDRLLHAYRVEITPVDRDDVAAAREGMVRFGKGRGREPAVLNFGDLFAYAAARRLDLPLLFKGNDFRRTDVEPFALAG